MRWTPEYFCWLRIKQCCTNPSCKTFKYYGGRGIKVCARWADSFEAFYADMGPRPVAIHRKRSAYSLDRIDNNGDYTPENCRWATYEIQENNRRYCRPLTFNGKTQTRAQWERELGLPKELIKQRLALGWSTKRILTTPVITKHYPKRLAGHS